MRIRTRAKLVLASILAGFTLVSVPLTAYAGYAPADRPTFQCVTPTNCPGAGYVVFNSFTNAPNYGDERAFFDGKDAGITGPGGYQDSINVHDGEHLVLRTYIHNNANPNAIGFDAATAHNTRMQILLPHQVLARSFATSAITADNANPGTVSDTVDFAGATPFSVNFDESQPVQITYRPGGTGDTVTRTLPSATFVNDQVMNASFNDWHGCFSYSALVTVNVAVHMQTQPPSPAYTCDALNIAAEADRTVKITQFATTATNGATFKNAVLTWGDNTAALTSDNLVGQSHQYAADGTYTVTATAHFTVTQNGQTQEVTAGGPQCQKQVTFTGTTPPKVTPPPSTPPSTPAALVNTGPGSVAALFGAATAAGTLLYRRMLARRLSQ